MKKSNAAISIILAMLMIATPLGVFTGMASASGPQPNAPLAGGSFGGGNGTVWAPYIIEDVDDLQNMTANLAGKYTLANDIDASITPTWNGGAGFNPVGNLSQYFTGSFNGQNHTITGLFINRPAEDYVGLFGIPGITANISNTGVVDANITGNNNVGGFCGVNYGSITNSYSTGSASGSGYVGGFCGYNFVGSSITNCYSTGSASGSSYVGGFCGYNLDSITNSYSTGSASGSSFVGGFCGYNLGGTITDCHWDNQTSGLTTSDGGTGNTTAQMKQQATYVNWNFTGTWNIIETVTYPFLRNTTLLVSTSQVTDMGTAGEDSPYMVDFDSAAQPHPGFGTVSWELETDAGWLSVRTDGMVFGTPVNADVGTYYVNVTTTDSFGREGHLNYSLTVANTAPVITTTDTSPATADIFYSVDYDSTDDPTTTWALETNAATGWLNGTPANSDAGIYWVNVSVSDGNGGTDYRNFTLTVLADTDGDGIPDNTDPDDDNDGWNDAVEITGGFDPLDNSSMPSDADSDGIADFMDPDFLTTTEYNNQTVNQTVWSNQTVWQNSTNNVTVGVSDADTDGDGWSDAVEILAGTDPEDDTDMPLDTDGDGIADFMDPAEPQTNTVTPAWAWGAVIAAIVLGVLAAVGFMRGGKPDGAPPPEETEPEESQSENEEIREEELE